MEQKKQERYVLTDEDNAFLMEYMMNDRAKKEYTIGPVKFTLQTIQTYEQLDAKKEMLKEDGTAIYMNNRFQIKLLRYSLKNFGDVKFETPGDAEIWLIAAGDMKVDKLLEAQRELQNYLKKLLDVSSDFSEARSS